jgi:hypothetical protein
MTECAPYENRGKKTPSGCRPDGATRQGNLQASPVGSSL